MATRILMFLKCPANLVFLRHLRGTRQSFKICQFSTCKVLSMEEKTPVKYSTSPAAKISIAETTGLSKQSDDDKIKKFIICISLSVFLIYFCAVREENDLDELLSGKATDRSEELELIDLKIKLAYCERNNLPAEKIKAKIEEILNKKSTPVFPK